MPVPPFQDDPWASTLSKRGIPGDELVSALQKYIRRGHLDEATLIAREMYETSAAMEKHLWRRLLIISASDCGDGTFLQPLVVNGLRTIGLGMTRENGDGWLFVAHAVRYLCTGTKDLTTDQLCMWAFHVMGTGERGPVIPDYALDIHTRRGQEMGRGVPHFLDDGCVVDREAPDRDNTFRDRVRAIVDAGEWED